MKVAVVGSGVSGLGATWLLNEYTVHEVHLFEADSRLGGHANTVIFDRPGKKPTDVDTSNVTKIVFNPSTYPNFINFLNIFPDLAERIIKTEMTFSVSRDMGFFEWAGDNLLTIFCQPSRLLDLQMWRLIYDVLRFNVSAQRFIIELESKTSADEEISIGTYLQRHGYSDSFRDNYLIPMTAAIWSTPPDKCALDFPAKTLIQFMLNHHLLQITGKPKWLTLRGGRQVGLMSQFIISRLSPSRLHLSTPIKALRSAPLSDHASQPHRVELTTASGEKMLFDHVILACHTDTTVEILKEGGGMTSEETRILESFKWNRNEAVLHCDEQLMPKARIAWSCWNYLTKSVTDKAGNYLPNINQVSLLDWMNALQHLSMKDHGPVLVTLNPPFDTKPSLTFGRYKYDHPILSEKAIRAQSLLPSIQGTRGISYAGAWTKYGFHEDGFTSGLRAAAAVAGPSAKLPFEIVPADRQPDRNVLRLARAFDVFESSGAAWLLGSLFVFVLALLRRTVEGLGVNLRHLEQTHETAEKAKAKDE
ncbi:FAD/NAD(P)-binding domain-containing protein [Dichomitus squalens]|nr:FAD/NAD(P)-binding domain-containing protein [Dichomitus squalens]